MNFISAHYSTAIIDTIWTDAIRCTNVRCGINPQESKFKKAGKQERRNETILCNIISFSPFLSVPGGSRRDLMVPVHRQNRMSVFQEREMVYPLGYRPPASFCIKVVALLLQHNL